MDLVFDSDYSSSDEDEPENKWYHVESPSPRKNKCKINFYALLGVLMYIIYIFRH